MNRTAVVYFKTGESVSGFYHRDCLLYEVFLRL